MSTVDTSDKSFNYYMQGEWKNAHGVGINAVPIRRKVAEMCSDPRVLNGVPFETFIVQFWHNGKWNHLTRSNAAIVYGSKLKS